MSGELPSDVVTPVWVKAGPASTLAKRPTAAKSKAVPMADRVNARPKKRALFPTGMKRATCRSPQSVRPPRLWLARPMGLASPGRPSGLVWSASPVGPRSPVWISCPRCRRGSSSDAVVAATRMSAAVGAGPRSSSSRPALAHGSSQMPRQPVHVPRQPVHVPARFSLARLRQAESAYSMFVVRINNTKQDQHHARATPTNTTHCTNQPHATRQTARHASQHTALQANIKTKHRQRQPTQHTAQHTAGTTGNKDPVNRNKQRPAAIAAQWKTHPRMRRLKTP